MGYLFLTLLGFIGGGAAMFVALDTKRRRIDERLRRQEMLAQHNQEAQADLQFREKKLEDYRAYLANEKQQFDSRIVSYNELQNENLLLKQDLRSLAMNTRKAKADRHLQFLSQEAINQK